LKYIQNGDNVSYISEIQVKSLKRRQVQESIIRYLRKYINQEGSILDMGTGRGEFISQVKARKLYAIDIDPNAKNFLPSSVKFFNGGIDELENFEPNSIDAVYASNFIEHLTIEEATRFLESTLRILKVAPNRGYLIILQPNFRYSYRNYFDDFTHKTIFTHVSMSSLLQFIGFEIIACEKKFLPYSLNSKKSYFSFLIGPYLKLRIRIFGGQMLIVASPKIKNTQ
jgi:ubiquinone/menaquinone biosynthesis C-methylase UbiE